MPSKQVKGFVSPHLNFAGLRRPDFMTSLEFRTNPLFLRNGFETEKKWGFPIVRKQEIELENIDLISYADTRFTDSEENHKKGIHFFIDDYKFEGVYRNPEKSIGKISQYAFVLTPDFSTYSDMDYWRQLESVAHSRWCGANWQDQGLIVIPTVTWSTPKSFEFCFEGIEKNSIVAIGMIGCKRSKEDFLLGYNEMLRRLEPSAIICFGTPFDDMKGNLIAVDYLESRKVVR